MLKIYIRRVEGSSMMPAIKQGNLIIAIRRKQYQPGKMVIADAGAREIIKRICFIKDNTVYLEGDNRYQSTDFKVGKDQILGEVLITI